MAWPKRLDEIMEQLTRIETKLDILTTPTPLEPLVVSPEEEAAAFAEAIDYDSYAVSELAARAGGLTPEQRAKLRHYERGHKNRKGALAALEEPS